MLEDLFTQHLTKDISILLTLSQIEILLNVIISKYTLHFNGKLLEKEVDVAFGEIDNYANPHQDQVGNLVEVNVGHIERYKLNEEMQLDYHLRKCGFSSQQSRISKPTKKLENTRKDVINY